MLTILQGDCLQKLREVPDESVQCVVTSPPYWGLRDYGVPATNWPAITFRPMAGLPPIQVPTMTCCHGLENEPLAYIAHEVAIFREVLRVLRSDGTCWVNLGDCYNGSGLSGGTASIPGTMSFRGKRGEGKVNAGLKLKDMVGQPWRVAFALQADGWYLRSDIVWSKPNPMPESVTDRPTKSHEYMFLLTKSKKYFYDAPAIKEPVSGGAHGRGNGLNPKCYNGSSFTTGKTAAPRQNIGQGPRHTHYAGNGVGFGHGYDSNPKPRSKQNPSFSGAVNEPVEVRNKRSVWTVPTFAFPDSHFATFPPDLIKPCILAGSKPGDTILDPFGGSGTTGQVAIELGRRAILIELNPEYVGMIERRCNVTLGLPLCLDERAAG